MMKQETHWLQIGVIASFGLHGLLLLLAQSHISFQMKAPSVIEVSYIPLPPPSQESPRERIRNQIISEPESPISKSVPRNTSNLAEQNRATEKEQIRRGDGLDAAPSIGKPGPRSPPTAPTEAQQSSSQPSSAQQSLAKQSSPQSRSPSASSQPKRISSLRLNATALQGEFGQSPREVGPKASELLRNPSVGVSNYQPFSRPIGSGARFIGSTGSADFMPNLPDGDITLLNAKASKFAVFVRRVATRVFSKLRASGWESLSATDISQMNDFSTIHAVLSPAGKLLSVKLEGLSGSPNFDGVLQDAVRNGASDPHPPPDAVAADGNVHFIFKAKSWTQVGPSRGGKGLAEQRWLLLSTGLG